MSQVNQWYYRKDGTVHGPVSGYDLKQLAQAGQLLSSDDIRDGALGNWVSAQNVNGLFDSAPESKQVIAESAVHSTAATTGPSASSISSAAAPAAAQNLQPRAIIEPAPRTKFGDKIKAAAQMAAKQAERAKVIQFTLAGAHLELGKALYNANFRADVVAPETQSIEQLESEIKKLQGPKPASNETGFKQGVKAAAEKVKDRAQIEILKRRLASHYQSLGERAEAAGLVPASQSEQLAEIAQLRQRVGLLDAQISKLAAVGSGSMLTARGLLLSVAVAVALIAIVAGVCLFRGRSRGSVDHQVAKSVFQSPSSSTMQPRATLAPVNVQITHLAMTPTSGAEDTSSTSTVTQKQTPPAAGAQITNLAPKPVPSMTGIPTASTSALTPVHVESPVSSPSRSSGSQRIPSQSTQTPVATTTSVDSRVSPTSQSVASSAQQSSHSETPARAAVPFRSPIPVEPEKSPAQDEDVRQRLAQIAKDEQSVESDSSIGGIVPLPKFVGKWQGIYQHYPVLMGAKLDLRATEVPGEVEGEIQIDRSDARSSQFNAPQGIFPVAGKYNEFTHSFSLTVTKMGGPPSNFVGVFDVSSMRLAGAFKGESNGCPFFIFARGKDGEKLSDYIMQSTVRSAKAKGVGMSEVDKAVLDSVKKWTSQFTREYAESEKTEVEIRNLFADDCFKRSFGKTFDQLDSRKLRIVQLALLHFGQVKTDPMEQDDEMRKFASLAQCFGTQGLFAADDITISVLAQRATRNWLSDIQSNLTELPPKPNSFALVAIAESAAKPHVSKLWPSEQQRFADVVLDTRNRLAKPVLKLSADGYVIAARGFDGARALAEWESRHSDLLKLLNADEKKQLVTSVNEQLDGLLQQLVVDDVRSIESFGHGRDAVIAGVKWYRHFLHWYGFALSRPPIQMALQKIQARRATDLADAAVVINDEITAQTNEDAVNMLIQIYLEVPGDDTTEASALIKKAATMRTASLRQ